MKTSDRWWILLLLAVAGCGPVNYWVGGYADTLSEMFPSIMPSTKTYVYPPGYDPNPPVPRNGPLAKPNDPPKPLPGDELYGPIDTGEAPASGEVPAKNDGSAAPAAGQGAPSGPPASTSAGPTPANPPAGAPSGTAQGQ